jgi:hypothetical protein
VTSATIRLSLTYLFPRSKIVCQCPPDRRSGVKVLFP